LHALDGHAFTSSQPAWLRMTASAPMAACHDVDVFLSALPRAGPSCAPDPGRPLLPAGTPSGRGMTSPHW